VKADIPDKLEAIIMKALAHQRDDRYETAADLQTDIEAYLDTKTGAAISDPKSLPIIDQHTASVLGSSSNTISSPDTAAQLRALAGLQDRGPAHLVAVGPRHRAVDALRQQRHRGR
jgi:hypothetical protein